MMNGRAFIAFFFSNTLVLFSGLLFSSILCSQPVSSIQAQTIQALAGQASASQTSATQAGSSNALNKARPVPRAYPEATFRMTPTIIGQFDQTNGDVVVKRMGLTYVAAPGFSLNRGDSILTGAKSGAIFRLTDGSQYQVGPSTQFDVNAYRFKAGSTQPSDFAAKLRLVFGAIQIATGKIGQTFKENYVMETPLSVIGVRGTEFTVRYCENQQCGEFSGASMAVTDGAVDFSNEASQVDLKKNDFSIVDSPVAIADILPIPKGYLDLNANLSDLRLRRTFKQKLYHFITGDEVGKSK